MEARIGAQITLTPDLPPEVRDNLVAETRGRILRHVYGPVEAEVRAALYSLYDAGIHGGDPAVDRLAALLDTFGRAFRGEVAA
ncbi:hypothetical protein E1832_07930 [Antarcticimicrobium luteum]|uniref:Uncharacterized protein n=1 Tax=Antarcticimicrobium luteum TaxID=2547397 RepID=A0A4R5VC30_9RHOB|nr:hypothetical protein E1832_07930 [Antarcticimicrobium luteum]